MSEFEIPTPLLEDVSELIFAEPEAAGLTVPQYMLTLDDRYSVRYWKGVLEELARQVEPVDSVCGRNPAAPTAKSFLRGNILGMRVVEEAVGVDFVGQIIGAILSSAEQFDPYGDDLDIEEAVRQTAAAEIILDVSGEGRASEDPNLVIVDTWGNLITPEIPFQRYTADGFGFILHVCHELVRDEADAIQRAQEEKFIQELAAANAGTFDWDADFRKYT